eukprot:scaffold541_cov138-Cylindrotheca_fusiformis.AAC.13
MSTSTPNSDETIPRPIKGTIGSRVRVILGSSGKQWLLILNKDDGNRSWQDHSWKSIPDKVATQLNNCTNKGRIVTKVDYGPTGAWFISGQKPDGTNQHSWWGNTSDSAVVKRMVGEDASVKVAFGADIFGTETRVLFGSSGYSYTSNLKLDRLKKIYGKSKKVHFLRLFHHGNYYVSDEEGSEWTTTIGEHLQNELKKSNSDIRDVAMAGDGTWAVVRDKTYVTSTGVDNELTNLLQVFYSEQRGWNNRRARQIQEARARLFASHQDEGRGQERDEQERLEREEQERRAREIAEREERERIVREKKAEHERKAKEELEAAATARVCSLEAVLEKRICDEAADIKTAEQTLKKRKRLLQEAVEEMPHDRRPRISLELDPKSLCVVCQDEKPVMAVMPCGHLCLCKTCSDSCLTRAGGNLCPLCRGGMKNTVRIYTST